MKVLQEFHHFFPLIMVSGIFEMFPKARTKLRTEFLEEDAFAEV